MGLPKLPWGLGSLRGELMRWLLLPLAGLVVINAYSAYRYALEAADVAYDRTLLASSRALAEGVTLVDGKASVDLSYAALDIFENDTPGRMYWCVTGIDGEFVSGYDDFPRLPASVPRSEAYPALVHFYTGDYQGTPLRIAALYQPLLDDTTRGMVLIQVGETMEARRALTQRMLVASLWPQLALVAAVALLMAFAVRRGLAPLRRLAQDVAARSPTDLSPYKPETVHKEVRPLVLAMNRSLARLSAVLESHRRFIADAAHQLRTPLTLLRTQTEVGLRERRTDELREALVAIHATVERTSHTTNRLLSLARIGHVAVENFIAVDLDALTREVCLECGPDAIRRGIDFAYEGGANQAVLGDRLLLHELVTNLVENAIRYTPEGGTVLVRLDCEAGVVQLRVEDSGPGIAEADRDRAFEPFVRLRNASAEGVAGSGLGLTIVRDIALAHGARITLETSGLGGLAVVVALAPATPIKARLPTG